MKPIICQRCQKRKGTVQWVGSGSIMDWAHGLYQDWCERCTVEVQLEYALEHKDDWIELEKRLEKL